MATLWQDGQFIDLNAQLNASRSGAEGVNDDGIVVGWADGKGFRFSTRTSRVRTSRRGRRQGDQRVGKRRRNNIRAHATAYQSVSARR